MGPTFILNFAILTLKTGRGETIVEDKKFTFFDKRGIFQKNSQTTVLNIDKLLLLHTVKR